MFFWTVADFWTDSWLAPLVPKMSESWYDYLVAAAVRGVCSNCLDLVSLALKSYGYAPEGVDHAILLVWVGLFLTLP